MEIQVQQYTDEWFELRQCVSVTASKFGDVVGAGIGLPYDFLKANLSSQQEDNCVENKHKHHGIRFEPIINEAYQLLTGLETKQSGFWLPTSKDMEGIAGASPDATVVDASGTVIGLAEFKAPVYCMYKAEKGLAYGIPRRYMAQVQGQMGICNQPWCDFMAICTNTKEIMLNRVYFNENYWKTLQERLKEYSCLLQEGRRRQNIGLEPLNFPAARNFKQKSVAMKNCIPGERDIQVEQLLEQDSHGRFRSKIGRSMWFSYEFLVGDPPLLTAAMKDFSNVMIKQIDQLI